MPDTNGSQTTVRFTISGVPADLIKEVDEAGRRERRMRSPMVVVLLDEAIKARRARRARKP